MSKPGERSMKDVLVNLPSVDEVYRTAVGNGALASVGSTLGAALVRRVIADVRDEMLENREQGKDGQQKYDRDSLKELIIGRLDREIRSEMEPSVRRVINATGVVIHTNLGRAPLSVEASEAVDAASRYCTLEYDIGTGKRGSRAAAAERMICSITGANASLIVNNCAAAALLVLTVFGKGKEVIVSRGELVEIGGDFRVPDVLEQSGAILREVGTTNRTKAADYERAIGADTSMFLRVHPSNYVIQGFTSAPSVEELVAIANKHQILFVEDQGSGALVDLKEFGLGGEPLVGRSIAAGADLVTFSGDKLLGGPQSGIIAGKTEHIEKLRKHPLYRALRPGKLVYAGLEATLAAYMRETHFREIPVLQMLSMSASEIEDRVLRFAETLSHSLPADTKIRIEVIRGSSVIGGGSSPGIDHDTSLIALDSDEMSASKIESRLRRSELPVIARIEDERVLIDLRTVAIDEEPSLAAAICAI